MGEYDWKIGVKKTAKNIVVMFGIPALIYLIDNIKDIVPPEHYAWVVPLTSGISYTIKNWYENK